ncbi:MAG: hypothetical protein IGQ88_06240 [Gloeomargaritaceae cyanobacterium C42_A2020_066]|nr:hypothetical protein [Gloeomargaritaceae cyanobacterium C42_A2020_066]
MNQNLNQLKDTDILDSLDLFQQEIVSQKDSIRKAYQAISDEIKSLGGVEALVASFQRVHGLASIIKDAELLDKSLGKLQESLDQAIRLRGDLQNLSLRLQEKEQALIGVCESLSPVVDSASERSADLLETVNAAQTLQSSIETLIGKGESLMRQFAIEAELSVRVELLLNRCVNEEEKLAEQEQLLIELERQLSESTIEADRIRQLSFTQLQALEPLIQSGQRVYDFLQQKSLQIEFLLNHLERLESQSSIFSSLLERGVSLHPQLQSLIEDSTQQYIQARKLLEEFNERLPQLQELNRQSCDSNQTLQSQIESARTFHRELQETLAAAYPYMQEFREDLNRVVQVKTYLSSVEEDLTQRNVEINSLLQQLEGLEARVESLQQKNENLHVLLEEAEFLANLRDRLFELESRFTDQVSSNEMIRRDVDRSIELAVEATNKAGKLSTKLNGLSSSFEEQLISVKSDVNDLRNTQKRQLQNTLSRKQTYILLGATLLISFVFSVIF